ncbi:ATP-dependent DNA helicase [Trichonephila clavipes]|nr:ATP-dependent DNA helicase [Trichonephila clavipes]
MIPHHALIAVDRLFRDLMGVDIPFGGKIFVLGGDWRQTLPDAVHANRTAIVETCLKNSPLWSSFKHFSLIRNMRTEPHKRIFADSIISEDYGEQNSFQQDFLNGITPSGMQPHVLNLKLGAVIMLLRNLNPSAGLCKGTRLIIGKLLPNVIYAGILTRHTKSSHTFIPRITLSPFDRNLPFQFQRRQFPVPHGFAMTINKSQGQTLQKVEIHLHQPVFSHGRLYVAFSRATSMLYVRVLVNDTKKQGKLNHSNRVFTKNVVFREVLL